MDLKPTELQAFNSYAYTIFAPKQIIKMNMKVNGSSDGFGTTEKSVNVVNLQLVTLIVLSALNIIGNTRVVSLVITMRDIKQRYEYIQLLSSNLIAVQILNSIGM